MLEFSGYNTSVMWEQAVLFERSAELGYDSENFVKCFMTGETGRQFYIEGDRMQWAGINYELECLEEEYEDKLTKTGNVFDSDVMYWVGWIYFFWHLFTEEGPKEIYEQVTCGELADMYLGYHGCSEQLVIETVKEKKGLPPTHN